MAEALAFLAGFLAGVVVWNDAASRWAAGLVYEHFLAIGCGPRDAAQRTLSVFSHRLFRRASDRYGTKAPWWWPSASNLVDKALK